MKDSNYEKDINKNIQARRISSLRICYRLRHHTFGHRNIPMAWQEHSVLSKTEFHGGKTTFPGRQTAAAPKASPSEA